MKSKKLLALICATAMTAGMLAGCGSSPAAGSDSGDSASAQGSASTEASAGQEEGNAEGDSSNQGGTASDKEAMTLEVFDVAANYQGVQSGWFGKVVKDRFNIELNILAPQVAGDALYQTRSQTGNLGDILILEPAQFQDCVKVGMVKDIGGEIWNSENLSGYRTQIESLNNGLEGNNGEIYGIPCEMLNTSPTDLTAETIYSSPLLRWDLYKEMGMPDIEDLDGLLDTLEQMQKAHPTNEAGDPAYALSLWPDWDGGDNMLGIANVVQITTWYGEKIKESLILQPDNTFIPLTDKSGAYYKMLKFLNDAYLRGLVDPDSFDQTWSDAQAKISNGQVYLMWYNWSCGFWNSQARLEDGTAFRFVPVKDQTYYADADSYYGTGRVWAVGSQVDDAKYERIMEFLDWYASPEGLMFQHDGIEDFTYVKQDDGTLKRINDTALMDNLPVPEEWGGGGYNDGNNQLNQWIGAASNMNPLTGEPYNGTMWKSYKEATMTEMKEEWTERFGAENDVEYMKNNKVLLASPNVSVALPANTPDIDTTRNLCNTEVCDASWRMIKAKDDAEFDQMWDEMTKTLDGLGFQELMASDTAKFTIELEAKLEAAKAE